MITIEDLRRAGYEVRVNHYRRVRGTAGAETMTEFITRGVYEHNEGYMTKYGSWCNVLSPCGGLTSLAVTLPTGLTLTSSAVCCDKDNYCKKLGNRICLGRLVNSDAFVPFLSSATLQMQIRLFNGTAHSTSLNKETIEA